MSIKYWPSRITEAYFASLYVTEKKSIEVPRILIIIKAVKLDKVSIADIGARLIEPHGSL
jgi:hypothetical protein